ncbi:MAG: response regulator [Bdellovibrionales bacterium]|nr:response regulator [Bdellovibrionales bacterium]
MQTTTTDSRSFKKILVRNVALPLMLTILLCGVFVALLNNLLGANRELLESANLQALENATLRSIIDSETGLRGYLLTGTPEYLEPRIRAARDLPARFEALAQAESANPAQIGNIEKLKSHFKDWDAEAQRAVEARRSGKLARVSDTELRKDLMDQVRADLDAIQAISSRARDDRAEQVDHTTRFALALTVLLSLLFGGGLAIFGRRQLLGLSSEYETILGTQAAQTAELERQSWLRGGLMQLGTRLRGDLSAEKVARETLDFVIEYLGATLGAFFSVGEDGFLQRLAAHALSAGAPTEFRAGEGLIGKAVASSEVLSIDTVPSGYTKIASALGESDPRHLVFAPLTADGEVQSVIELGFLEKPDAEVLEFLRQSAELCGVALRSAVYRQRLQDLLNESQQLSEELQTQQEELRVSNEELSERSQALQESTTRLEAQQSELQQTNEQLEEQAQLLETQRRDIEERNAALEQAQGALEDRARQLETASRYKSEFMANMSHELRTPLNSSLILAKLLQDNASGNLTEEQVHFASTIYDAGNDLLRLINDILDLSKVEAGKLDLNPERVPVAKILQGMERLFRPTAEAKGLALKLESDPNLDSIVTDRQRLDQILRNLLANAIKFTAKGSVTLEAKPDGKNRIRFRVRDTGIGIDPAQHAAIFEAFHQADGTISRKYGGTGLGLSIAQSLAQRLGGMIELDSRLGEGATFTFSLPIDGTALAEDSRPISPPIADRDPDLAPAPVPAPLPKRRAEDRPAPLTEVRSAKDVYGFADDRDAVTGPGLRTLLVVEDEAPFAKILLDLGRELDFKVLLAGTSGEGYALATKYLPSAVVLDMKLPDFSGLSLLDRLKENPKTRHIPVHGMSVADYSREALHLGAIGFLMKPADREELKATLRRLEEKNAQRLKRVLVVEDDATQRESIERLIADPAVEIVSVGSGEEGLAALEKSTFDCMIMDLRLPDMSGFQLLEKMAQGDDRAFPPVIVYTGHDLSRPEEERLRRYSKSIIIKGARSPERLLDEVTLFLHQVESRLSPERQRILQASRNREKAFEGRSILVVDDDVRNVFALTSALESKGAKVTIARNGREAVDCLRKSPESGRRPIDLVLMDIMMPEMDGFEATREIRRDSRFADLPIIAVTAKAMRDDYERCIQAGANDYLPKPVELDRLISLMRVWLPKQVGRA